MNIDMGGVVIFDKLFDNIGIKLIVDYEIYVDEYIYCIGIFGCDVNGKVFVG